MFDIHKKILSNYSLLGIVLKSLWKALKLPKISLYSSLYILLHFAFFPFFNALVENTVENVESSYFSRLFPQKSRCL